MIIGTGIDLVDIARFERSMTRTPRLLERLFTASEQTRRLRSLAARYAAKEALIKALGGSDGVYWTDIEIASEPSGRPHFMLTGSTAQVVAERGITALHLSLTHDAGLAAAYVVAESISDAPAVSTPAAASSATSSTSAETPSYRRDPALRASTAGGVDDNPGSRREGEGERA